MGPCLTSRPPTPEGAAVLDRLEPERPLLLVALGSAWNNRPDFYRAVLDAFRDSHWQVLLSAGRRTDLSALGPVPTNAVVTPWVPQLEALQRASAFVSHGGMGSVMESLHHRVPLVLLPQMVEQSANADRLVAAGAGRRLRPQPKAAEIRAAVEHVATDPTVAAATTRLRDAIHAAGGTRRAVDVLERFAARGARS